ncbi:MAG TPA: hypothetical protein VMQ93_16020 [Novosphingobium sp.]|nr:hypothetical protein [Novosphingobium sp.]
MTRPIVRGITPATLLLLAAALVWACLSRGPWYDELYTQFVTRPAVPWLTALKGSWLADNHPPLYYMLARASAWLGPIPHHRLLNLAMGALAVAGCAAIVRDVPRLAAAAMALALGLAANEWTLLAGSELRSYFLSLCAGAVLALSLCALRLTGTTGSGARRATYWGTALVGFNTHIVSSLTCAALVAPFLAAALWRRDWREARAIAAPPLVAGLLLLAVTAIQLPTWLANTSVFWIEPGFSSARWSVELVVLHTLAANRVLLAGALAGAGLMARDVLRRQSSAEGGALCLLGLGAAIAMIGLVALHMLRPMLIEKYLMVLIAAIAMGIALGFGRLLDSLGPRLRLLVLAAAFAATVMATVHNAKAAVDSPSWFGTGRLVAAEVARCPGTVVHVDPIWNADVIAMMPRDNARTVPFAYRYVANALGFRLARAGSREMARTCPTIFWAEHDSTERWDVPRVTARLRERDMPVEGLRFRRVGKGWIALVPPPPAS